MTCSKNVSIWQLQVWYFNHWQKRQADPVDTPSALVWVVHAAYISSSFLSSAVSLSWPGWSFIYRGVCVCRCACVYFCVPESLQRHQGPISRVDYVSELCSRGREPNHSVRRGCEGGSPHGATKITPAPNTSLHYTSNGLAVITAVYVSDRCDICRLFRAANSCIFTLLYECVQVTEKDEQGNRQQINITLKPLD